MVTGKDNSWSARIATAARRLIEGDLVNAAQGRFSRTVFMTNLLGDELIERCAFQAALGNGLGAVSLRSGRDKGATPRRANVAFAHEGAPLEVRDCVLWAEDSKDRIVLVPWDAREERHFAIGPNGLEQRAGRPAAMLGQGMSQAKSRLERLARSLRHDQLVPSVTIVTDPVAA